MAVSQRRTDDRTRLKDAAHQARRDLLQGRKINDEISRGDRPYGDLSSLEKTLLDDFNSGKLENVRDERDAAFGWSQAERSAAGSAASSLTFG